jgi:hypothetical protein
MSLLLRSTSCSLVCGVGQMEPTRSSLKMTFKYRLHHYILAGSSALQQYIPQSEWCAQGAAHNTKELGQSKDVASELYEIARTDVLGSLCLEFEFKEQVNS